MLSPGQVVGDYEIVSLVGEGGMATVYKVRHTVLGSEHALKVLHPSLVRIAEARERFLAEGRIQARLIHPNIVDVIGVVSEGQVAGLVMAYLDGPTLGQRLAAQGGPLPLDEIADIMVDLLGGVRIVHDAGIVHRDLKPDNIKLQRDPDGSWRPVLFDFGVARLSGLAETLVGHVRRLRTQAGKRMGTPGYMSPEQIHSASDIDARTDVFALGCILYELLSGQQAFPGDVPRAIMERIVEGEPTDLRSLAPTAPPALVAVAQRAMRRDRAARYTDAAEMLAAVQAALAPPPVRPRRKRRSLDLLVLALGGLLITALAATTPLLLRAQQRHADQTAQGAVRQLAYTRTDRGASRDEDRIADAIKRAEAAIAIRTTPKTLGVAALARVWADGWDKQPATEAVLAQLPEADAMTARAAAAGSGEGELARALVVAAACTRLPADDPRRAHLCDEAPRRFDAAADALADDPRAWLRFEVWWSAAAHTNRVAAGWWSAQDGTQARAAWEQSYTLCQRARTDLSAAPLHDVQLARACMQAASGLGRYSAYFRWARWLRDHDAALGGISSETVAQVYRTAHPDCGNLAAQPGAPWQPAPRSRRQRFCQHAGLMALGCASQSARIRDRYLRNSNDPLLQALRDAYQPDTRRCYLEN